MRYLKLLIVLSLFVFAEKSYGQLSMKVSPKEYYDFFNLLVNPDSVNQFNLESQASFDDLVSDSASIFTDTALFSTKDVQFMKLQIGAAQSFRWKPGKILGARVISSNKIKEIFTSGVDEGWMMFYKKYGRSFMTYSVPLFTIDKKTCVVYTARHCGGLCGQGSTSLYKKINGKWIFIHSIGMIWVS